MVRFCSVARVPPRPPWLQCLKSEVSSRTCREQRRRARARQDGQVREGAGERDQVMQGDPSSPPSTRPASAEPTISAAASARSLRALLLQPRPPPGCDATVPHQAVVVRRLAAPICACTSRTVGRQPRPSRAVSWGRPRSTWRTSSITSARFLSVASAAASAAQRRCDPPPLVTTCPSCCACPLGPQQGVSLCGETRKWAF